MNQRTLLPHADHHADASTWRNPGDHHEGKKHHYEEATNLSAQHAQGVPAHNRSSMHALATPAKLLASRAAHSLFGVFTIVTPSGICVRSRALAWQLVWPNIRTPAATIQRCTTTHLSRMHKEHIALRIQGREG
jgi:hypothetical protein